ncbi:glutaredoxin family protein [Virgibacillus sp. FSP13]
MKKKDVKVYINSNQDHYTKLLDPLNKLEIEYEEKDVTENPRYMKELQDRGIYGTPVTIIDGEAILGFQINKIKQALGMGRYFG